MDAADNLDLASKMLELFRGREDRVALAGDKGFSPRALKQHETPLPPLYLAGRHLAGKRCMGFYLMRADSTLWCACIDFDSKPSDPDPQIDEKVKEVTRTLFEVGIYPLVERSQSGHGYHVWVFFNEPVPAWQARRFLQAVAAHTGTKVREIYPRQDELADGMTVGNLIRYPLWNKSEFLTPNLAAIGSPLDHIEEARAFSAEQICTACGRLGEKMEKADKFNVAESLGPNVQGVSPRVANLLKHGSGPLTGLWGNDPGDQSDSGVAFKIACELIRNLVPDAEVKAAIKQWMLNKGKAEKGNREDWLNRTIEKAYDLLTVRKKKSNTRVVTMEAAEDEAIRDMALGRIVYFESGIQGLDDSIDGSGIGELTVVAARPSHGKTALMLHWAEHQSQIGTSSILFSQEMLATQLARRSMQRYLKDVQFTPNNVNEIQRQKTEYRKGKGTIHVVENPCDIETIDGMIDHYSQDHGVKLIGVDYLQIIKSRKKSGPRETVDEVSGMLKEAAQRNKCSVILLCQLNRGIEGREDFEPRMSDLKESGGTEQNADNIVCCVWPWMVDPNQPKPNYCIHVLKRRNGGFRNARVMTYYDAERQIIGIKPEEPPQPKEPDTCQELSEVTDGQFGPEGEEGREGTSF